MGQGAGDPEGETQGDPSAERPAVSSAPSRLGLSHEAAGDAGTAPPLDVRTDEAARFPEPAPPPGAAPGCLGLQGESPGSRGRSLPSKGSGSAGPLAVGARDPGLAPRGCQAPPSTPPTSPRCTPGAVGLRVACGLSHTQQTFPRTSLPSLEVNRVTSQVAA